MSKCFKKQSGQYANVIGCCKNKCLLICITLVLNVLDYKTDKLSFCDNY